MSNPKIAEHGKKTRWKKGAPPKSPGRPKKLPEITELLDKVLGEIGPTSGLSGIEAMLKALHRKAVAGDVRASEVLLNRYYGMPKQKSEVENTGVMTINFIPDGNKHSDKKPT